MIEHGGILIVDDNEMNREICNLHLEELGTPLHLAKNGTQGLELAHQTVPDLILLDIMMPDVDGFEVLKQLKEHQKLRDIPVLMLTAKTETNSVVAALEMGANDYLKKPFEGEELIARAKTLLKARKLELQLASDLNAGMLMQQRFLTDAAGTTQIFENSKYNIKVYNKPHSTVSGDFYYSFIDGNGSPGIFIGDSTGHGLSAALISMRIIGLLQQVCTSITSPIEALQQLNKDIFGLLPDGNFVAASALIFEDNGVRISNAAQPYPVLCTTDYLSEIKNNAMPLGINPESEYTEDFIELNLGDRLILYTDGLIEAVNSEDNVYGKVRLTQAIEQFRHGSIVNLQQALLNDVNQYTDNQDNDDDVTLVIIEKKIEEPN